MKLYHSPTSPYVRKVMVLLHETGQLDDVELVATTVTPVAPDAELLSRNPLSKVPALELDAGPALYDSRVICAFLDDRAQAGMYGQDARHWEVKTLEATADGILDAAILMVYEARLRPGDKRWDDWIEAQWAKVARALSALNGKWMGHLTGPLDMGQIAIGCALGYLDLRHGDRNWRADNPGLASWYAGFESRDSMLATRPPAG